MENLKNVILYPHMTEKSASSETELQQVAFIVVPNADKILVRRAIEEIFKVQVRSIRMVNVKGKMKRVGRFEGKRSDYKKAIVTLEEGYNINLYEARN